MSSEKKTTNVTHERLTGLPFKKASDLKKAQDQIHFAVWQRLEEAKAIDSLTRRPEYQFWREEFARGLTCRYGDEGDDLVRVYSDGVGIKIAVNEAMNTQESSEALLGTLVKSMSESFATTYYKAKGILPLERPYGPELEKTQDGYEGGKPPPNK
jgi:hypothetical protein